MIWVPVLQVPVLRVPAINMKDAKNTKTFVYYSAESDLSELDRLTDYRQGCVHLGRRD